MCRWIAYIAQHPLLLEDLLIDAPHPITADPYSLSPGYIWHYLTAEQPDDIFPNSDNPEGPGTARYNFDGFGVTWYSETRSQFDSHTQGPLPTLYRTTAIAASDESFVYLCRNSASNCILGHVRAGTRPPAVASNNHPFVFGRHSFMHNGEIAEFPKIRLAMLEATTPKYTEMISGNTDSEHFAALYFTYLGDVRKSYTAKEMRNALVKALRKLHAIQVQILGHEVSNDMNLCATDGENLVALRWTNGLYIAEGENLVGTNSPYPPTGKREPHSLYVSYDAAASLDRKIKNEYNSHMIKCTPEELTKHATPASEQNFRLEHGNPFGPHVIVASEPATFNKYQWWSLENGQFIMVDKKSIRPTKKLDVTAKEVNLESESVVNDRWEAQVAFDYLDFEQGF